MAGTQEKGWHDTWCDSRASRQDSCILHLGAYCKSNGKPQAIKMQSHVCVCVLKGLLRLQQRKCIKDRQEWIEGEYCGSSSSSPHEKWQPLGVWGWFLSGLLHHPCFLFFHFKLFGWNFTPMFYIPEMLKPWTFLRAGKYLKLKNFTPSSLVTPSHNVCFIHNISHCSYLNIYFNHVTEFYGDGKHDKNHVSFILYSQ